MTVAEMTLRDALADCRRAKKLANMYAQRHRELSIDGLRSPGFDGGRGCSGPGEPRAVTLDAARRMAEAAAGEAKIAQQRARRALRPVKMSQAKLMFLTAYYVEGQDFSTAANLADRSMRQCWRYIRELFGSPPEETQRELARK